MIKKSFKNLKFKNLYLLLTLSLKSILLMSKLSHKCFIALSLSSFVFSPTAYLSAKEKNTGVSIEVVSSEKITETSTPINLTPTYPMPLIREGSGQIQSTARETFLGKPGFFREGGDSNKRITSIDFPAPVRHGTSIVPHTTQLVRGYKAAKRNTAKDSITTTSPYNRAGKLYIIQSSTSSSFGACSASMIGRGLVLTASHCLFSYGESPSYRSGSSVLPYKVYFVPSANKTTTSVTLAGTGATGPYGSWQVDAYAFPICYVRGNCTGGWTSNDIALMRLKKKSGSKPLPFQNGIGYFGYGWNNYGFVRNKLFGNIKSNQLTQLGYPAGLGDSTSNFGGAMVRTDALARQYSRTNEWGSMQSPGASGGPAIVNFGRSPNVTSRAHVGTKTAANILVGTLSYGYTDSSSVFKPHKLGASIFGRNANFRAASYRDTAGKNWGSGNIGALMRAACGKGYGNWKASGYCRSAS